MSYAVTTSVETVIGAQVPVGRRVPPTALTLLDETGDLSRWRARDGGPAPWRFESGFLEVTPGAGDLVTDESYLDFQLHLEFWVPWMPEATGQDRGNSGVFLQGRYELQILDSHGAEPSLDCCGAIYKLAAPLWNASAPPETWQTFDVAFRAPILDTNGLIVEHARLTVFHNGLLVHDNVSIRNPTDGALDPYEAQPGPLRLQDHGCAVRFRHIWIVPVEPECPPGTD